MTWRPILPLVLVGLVVLTAGLAGLVGAARRSGRASLGSAARLAAAALMVVIIGLRPTVGGAPPPAAERTPVDVVILVDRTTSMAATDHEGRTRLEGAARDVAQLVDASGTAGGVRFSVIAFDNAARVVLPFSTDRQATVTAVQAMGWREAFYGTGSDVGIAVEAARAVLESSRAEGARERRLVYLGDGEQTAQAPPASFAALRPLLTGSLVLGYGTTSGGRMAERVGSDRLVMVDGQPAVSRIDEANLRRIADETGGSYQHRPGPVLPVVDGGLAARAPDAAPRTELGWIAGLLAALLLVWEVGVAVRRWRVARKELL